MVTGDNLLTAMSVARECGILDSRKKAFVLDLSTGETADGRPKLKLDQVGKTIGPLIKFERFFSRSVLPKKYH